MAYITTEQVKEIRKEIKKVLTSKDGFKLSITKEHYSGVNVRLMQSPLKLENVQTQVNNAYLESIECENTKLIFQLVDKAINRVMGEDFNRNANDPGADYSDYNYYKWYRVGRWDKACELV